MELRRVLGFRDLVFFYTLTCFSLRNISTAAEAGPSSLAVWIFAALGLFVPLVASVLELSSRYPEEGGLYVWTRRAFGDLPGFLAGFLTGRATSRSFRLSCISRRRTLCSSGASEAPPCRRPAFFIAFSLSGIALATAVNARGCSTARGSTTPPRSPRGRRWRFSSGAESGRSSRRTRHVVRSGLALPSVGSRARSSSRRSPSRSAASRRRRFSATRSGIRGATCRARSSCRVFSSRPSTLRAPRACSRRSRRARRARSRGSRRRSPPCRRGRACPAPGLLAALLVTWAGVGTTGAWLATASRLPFVGGLDHFPAARVREGASPVGDARLRPPDAVAPVGGVRRPEPGGNRRARRLRRASRDERDLVLRAVPVPVRLDDPPLEGARARKAPSAFRGGRPWPSRSPSSASRRRPQALALAFVPPDDEPNKLLAVSSSPA